MYEKNIRVIPTHRDVFNSKAMTQAEVVEGLKEFSSLAIIHMCAKLMLFLCSEDAQKPKKQTELALGLLDQETRDRLQAFVDGRKEEQPNVVIFHHVPVMLMLKLNLANNTPEGRDIDDEATRTKFARMLISLCDLWLMDGKLKGGNPESKTQSKHFLEGFRAYQAKQYLQDVGSEPMINLLSRGRYLLDKVRADGRIDVDGIFKGATGLELSLYMDILLMILAQWTVNVETDRLDSTTVRTVDQYFNQTNIDHADVEKFLDILGFHQEDFVAHNDRYLQMIGMASSDELVNFVTFMQKPILRYDDKFLCISPKFLLLQLTEGPYNILREAVKGTKEQELLPAIWGEVYEQYALDRLKGAFGGSVHSKLKDKSGKESVDALIDLHDVALVTEIKYPHWSFRARITGRREDMHGYMEKIARYHPKKEKLGKPKVDKKKGLGQIRQFIEKVDSGVLAPPIDLKGKALIPVLVVGEEYPVDPVNRRFLEGYAAGEGCLMPKDGRVAPFILLTSEEIELIESLVESIGVEKTKALLVSYVGRFHPKYREEGYSGRATSFKNEIYNQGIKVTNSKFMHAQITAAFDPVREYFTEDLKKATEPGI